MKVTAIGTGYVGLVTGACLAEMGNHVVCLDVDPAKIRVLNDGEIPIHEPGLKEIVRRNVAAGRLQFTTDADHAVQHGTLLFVGVGTPPDEDGSADLQYVVAAARSIGQRMTDYKVIVDKSTVPVGTAAKVKAAIQEELDKRGRGDMPYAVISNPEFLKEGAAVEDFMKPDRIIIGADDEQATLLMRALYAPFNRTQDRMLIMDVKSAEFTKYAANAMLATRISFMNELALLAERVGADIELVRRGIGSDPRIGYQFLYAGAGYGGSCFPKDVKALVKAASDTGIPLQVLTAVEAANERLKQAGVAAETKVVEAHAVWRGILESAEAVGADLIVMGSHGRRGLEKLVLGSVALDYYHLDDALEHYERVTREAAPESREWIMGHQMAADIMAQQGFANPALAYAHAQQALAHTPESDDWHVTLSEHLRRAGELLGGSGGRTLN